MCIADRLHSYRYTAGTQSYYYVHIVLCTMDYVRTVYLGLCTRYLVQSTRIVNSTYVHSTYLGSKNNFSRYVQSRYTYKVICMNMYRVPRTSKYYEVVVRDIHLQVRGTTTERRSMVPRTRYEVRGTTYEVRTCRYHGA